MRGLKTPGDAWFGGDTLRDADSRIHSIRAAQEITEKTEYGENTGMDGKRRKRARRESIRVTITFSVLETADPVSRQLAVEAANAWARDGFLEISDKPERRLYVTCQKRAAIKEPENPKEKFTLVFETAESPFWEDKTAASFAFTAGTTGSQTLRVPGTADTVAEATVTPSGGSLNTLTLRLGDSYMYFSGLNVAAGTALVIDHDDRGYLRIMAGTATKYHCRLGASDDELAAPAGNAIASFTANTSCAVTFTIRGKYK